MPVLTSLACVAETDARSEAPRRRWVSTGLSAAAGDEGGAMGSWGRVVMAAGADPPLELGGVAAPGNPRR